MSNLTKISYQAKLVFLPFSRHLSLLVVQPSMHKYCKQFRLFLIVSIKEQRYFFYYHFRCCRCLNTFEKNKNSNFLKKIFKNWFFSITLKALEHLPTYEYWLIMNKYQRNTMKSTYKQQSDHCDQSGNSRQIARSSDVIDDDTTDTKVEHARRSNR